MASTRLLGLLIAAACWTGYVSTGSVPHAGRSSPVSVSADNYWCCNFEEGTCGFLYNADTPGWWDWSGDGSHPDYTEFVDFTADSRYMWTADSTESITVSPQLINIRESTAFGFRYFAHTEDSTSACRIYFQSSDGTTNVLLDTLGTTNDLWVYKNVSCVGRSCCSEYPCLGTIKIDARVTSGHGLFVFDEAELNGGCNVPPTTTTPLPTETPTPSPATGCCKFDGSDPCGFDITKPPYPAGSWEWSGYGSRPNATLFPAFPTTGNYIFTENENNAVTLSGLYQVFSDTEFGVTYYGQVSDLNSALIVTFVNQNGDPEILIDVLGQTGGTWVTRTFVCATSECCPSYPCNGQIKFEARIQTAPDLFAIDQVNANDGCS